MCLQYFRCGFDEEAMSFAGNKLGDHTDDIFIRCCIKCIAKPFYITLAAIAVRIHGAVNAAQFFSRDPFL